MDISVIVPVFNVGKYLVRCLDSICKQSFSGTFEVITVDDASTDNSLTLLKEYAKSDDKVIIIEHNVNKKLSVTRSTGMKAATGDYIIHVDSDDWLLPNALETLFCKSKETNADVIVYGYCIEDIKGIRKNIEGNKSALFTTNKIKVQNHFLGTVVNKMVRRKLTWDMIYGLDYINSGEDIIYNTEILIRATNIFIYPHCLYVYFQHFLSITNSINAKSMLEGRIILLKLLHKLFSTYPQSDLNPDLILCKFEKIIIGFSFQYWLTKQREKLKTDEIIDAFQLFQSMSSERIFVINSVLTDKKQSVYYTLKYFGVKYVFYQILKSFLKR
jgi:glycosyltransferase involved in cell wall biosynthesis